MIQLQINKEYNYNVSRMDSLIPRTEASTMWVFKPLCEAYLFHLK